MTPKTILNPIRIIMLFSMFMAACSQQPPDETPTASSAMIQLMTTMQSQVSQQEYRYIMGMRYFVYTLKMNEDTVTIPNFIDPVINVQDLMDYRRTMPDFSGIRIYPGLTSDLKMIPIICLSDSVDRDEESYLALQNGDYTRMPFYRATSIETPERLHERFFSSVLINGKAQAAFGVNDTITKRSRYYSWDLILSLLRSNIPAFDEFDSKSFSNWRVKIESGYFPDFLVDVFEQRAGIPQGAKFHQGYTIVWQVQDSTGTNTIDPFTGYSSEEPYNYSKMYLEVGSPCPPTCGTLHQLN